MPNHVSQCALRKAREAADKELVVQLAKFRKAYRQAFPAQPVSKPATISLQQAVQAVLHYLSGRAS